MCLRRLSHEMLLFFTFLIILGVSSGSSCPKSELIAPACKCSEIFGNPMMVCKNVLNVEELTTPIRATVANGFKLFSLEISNSSLLYLPHNLLDGTGVQYIRLENSQLMSLSDTDVAFEGLEDSLLELRATTSNYISAWDWQQLRNLKKLQLIDVHHIQMGSVEEPFPELKELNALGLSDSGISFIVDYAFADLPKLKILVLKGNSITTLARSMFPKPAHELVALDLSDNELESLPNDMFRAMPMLENVYLDNNRFTTLNEVVFKEAFKRVSTLSLNGNKLVCDCRVRWVVGGRRPFDLLGKCAKPEMFAGRELRSLQFHELFC